MTELIGKNQGMKHLLNYGRWYLLGLLIIVLSIPMLVNYVQAKPLIMASESYFHLDQTRELGLNAAHYLPLHYLQQFPQIISFLPITMALIAYFLLLKLADKMDIQKKFTFFFAFFLIMSPAFMFTFSIISGQAFFVVLILLSFYLLSSKEKVWQYLSLFPLILATTFDLYSIILLLILQAAYVHRRKGKFPTVTLGIISVLFLVQALFLDASFMQGPFYEGSRLSELVSDFGGKSGISFFMLLLAMIGVTVTWQRNNLYFPYFILPVVITGYIVDTQSIFFLSLAVTFFATVGFIKLFEIKWELDTLKKYTLLLLMLGVLFSSITYLERINENGPSADEQKALEWIRDDGKGAVFSTLENDQFILYIAEKAVVEDEELKQSILSSIYIDELFPLLEENGIKTIFLTGKMKENLPESQGLRFLLKNERFKLAHSSGKTEVWMFK
jgi:hypothetical protein